MANGGEIASRGFIFQAVIALIECLDPDNDWDQIKNEPNTDEDKVDIKLYKDDRTMSAIQVKSSINAFERADVAKWLEKLKSDAKDAENVCLYLVGDHFTPSCENYIKENPDEIKIVPFEHLQRISTGTLVGYINRVGLGEKVRVTDLDLIDASLFSEILRNSIAREPVSRGDFEAVFQKAIPQGEELEERIIKAVSGLVHKEHVIPLCLTPIPLIDKEIGLVGRDDVVKDIRKRLEESSCIVLVNGLGGIGKTAVMQGICNDLKDEGYYVAWISCGDSLQDDLLMLREALGVPKEEKADTAYSLVKAGIQQLGKKFYLFMDDLSRDVTRKERDEINALGVHVMITSRTENLPFRKMKLEYLDEESAIKMFYGYYGREFEDSEIIRKILRSINNHTLLVELLAKAASKKGGTLEDFLDGLEEQGIFDVFKRKLSTEHDQNRTIEECVMGLYRTSELTTAQQNIMKLFTIFTPEKEIYYKIGEWAELDMDAMDELVDLGWLEQGGLENGYHIHQIIRDSIARQMEKNGEHIRLEDYGDFIDTVIDTDSYLGRTITYEIVRERIILTEDISRFFIKNSREDADAGALFNSMGEVYHAQGNYDRALEFFEKVLVIREKVLGMDHPGTAITYNNMASVYYALGDYEKALEFLEKARLIQENVLGMDHPDTASTYNNIAGVYHDLGDYEKALKFYEKAQVIKENKLGKEHPSTAATYNSIAIVYRDQGDYEKALEFLEKARVIREKVLGMNHPDTATTYNNIASVYRDQGDYEKALEFLEKARVIREKVLGMNHPDTAITYNNIASVYHYLGDFEKALTYYKKALGILENVLGMNHPSTATTYNNMACVYQEQGDYEKALEYYEKSNHTFLAVFGEDHPHTWATALSIKILTLLLMTGMTEDELIERLKNATPK